MRNWIVDIKRHLMFLSLILLPFILYKIFYNFIFEPNPNKISETSDKIITYLSLNYILIVFMIVYLKINFLKKIIFIVISYLMHYFLFVFITSRSFSGKYVFFDISIIVYLACVSPINACYFFYNISFREKLNEFFVIFNKYILKPILLFILYLLYSKYLYFKNNSSYFIEAMVILFIFIFIPIKMKMFIQFLVFLIVLFILIILNFSEIYETKSNLSNITLLTLYLALFIKNIITYAQKKLSN